MSLADDRFAIYETLAQYCRGVDRMDAELTLACFLEEATIEVSGLFEGTPAEYVAWLWPVHGAMLGHTHAVSNIIVEIQGDTAASESYVALTLRMNLGDELVDVSGKARCLDTWRRAANGSWQISARMTVSDLARVDPVELRAEVNSVLSPQRDGLRRLRGRRDRTDHSYELLTVGTQVRGS